MKLREGIPARVRFFWYDTSQNNEEVAQSNNPRALLLYTSEIEAAPGSIYFR